jgi:hypothetical protein
VTSLRELTGVALAVLALDRAERALVDGAPGLARGARALAGWLAGEVVGVRARLAADRVSARGAALAVRAARAACPRAWPAWAELSVAVRALEGLAGIEAS